jgi:Arc/MetJ-type ribon-helix-helix transcriptional regulator
MDEGVGHMKMIHTEVPEKLYKKAIALVEEGWYRDEKEVFSEAIRRFLEAHQPELMERFLREDVEWGLHGNE